MKRATDSSLENGMAASLDVYINCEACICHATCTCDEESDRLIGFLALLTVLRQMLSRTFWGQT